MKEGGCQCGAIRFELLNEPSEVYACHCNECRKQSASAFGVSVIHAPGDLRITQGSPQHWSRATDSGDKMTCAFCGNCGSRLWHAAGGCISIKGGALDVPPDVRTHIWISQKVPWVVLPEGAETWQNEPDT